MKLFSPQNNGIKISLNAEHFKDIYDTNEELRNFETSEYEAIKFATIAALPKKQNNKVLEIGCSIRVFTKLLVQKCTQLRVIDF